MSNDDLKVQIGIEADTKPFLKGLNTVIQQCNTFFSKKAVKEVKIKLTSEEVDKQFEKVKKHIEKNPLAVKIKADTEEVKNIEEDIDKATQTLTKAPIEAKVTADTKEAEEKTKELKQQADEATQKRQMELEAMTVGALEDLRKLEHVARDTGEKIDSDLFVEVRADYGKAQEALEKYKKEFKAGYAEMNETQREAGRSMIKHLKNVEVEAGRHLNNVTNTGEKTLSRLQMKFDQVTKKIGLSFQKFATLGITALGAIFSKKSFDILNENIAIQTRFEKITTNVGKQQGKTTEEIKRNIETLNMQASALAKVGVSSENNIKTVQTQLGTFDLSSEAIEAMTEATLNYVVAEKGASASSDEYQSMTNQLAQALNGNFASLTKAGFVLDEHTKALISEGSEMERVQAIAEVLNSTYAGFNEALLNTPEGQILKLQEEMENLQASIAGIVAPAITVLIEGFRSIVSWVLEFINKNKEFIKNIGIVGGAIAGLTLLIYGIVPALSAVGIAVGVIFSPVILTLGLVAGAIGWVTFEYSKQQKKLDELKGDYKKHQTKLDELKEAYQKLTKKIQENGKATEEQQLMLERLNEEIRNTEDAMKNTQEAIEEQSENMRMWNMLLDSAWESLKALGDAFVRLGKIIWSVVVGIVTTIVNFVNGVIESVKKINNAILSAKNPFDVLKAVVLSFKEMFIIAFNALLSPIAAVINSIDSLIGWFRKAKKEASETVEVGNNFVKHLDEEKKASKSSIDLGNNLILSLIQKTKKKESYEDFMARVNAEITGQNTMQENIDIEEIKKGGGGGGGGSKKKTPEQLEEERNKEAEKALKAEIERKKKREEALLRQKKEALEKERKTQLEHINQTEKNELNRLAKRQEINKLFDKKLENLTKDSAQIQRELEEERLQEMQKITGELANLTTQEEQRRENLTKTYEKESEKIVEAVEKMQKDILKTIEEVNHALDTLEEDTTSKYLKRNVDAKKEMEKAQKELQELTNKHNNIAYMVDFLPNWSNISRDEKIGDVKISEIEKYKELLDLVKKLREEQEYIAGVTTQDQRNAQDTYEELSKAEQITQEYEKQKAILEEKKRVHEAILAGEEINLDEIQDYKNRQLAEELIAKRDGFEQEKAMLKAKYDADLANYEDLQKALQKLSDETTEAQLANNLRIIQSEKEVLKAVMETMRARGKNSSFASSVGGNSSQTVNVQNTNNITLNNEVNNNIDLNRVNNSVIQSIQNEQQGISNIKL